MKLIKLTTVAALALALTGCSDSHTFVIKDPASWSDGACSAEKPGVTLSVDYLGKVTTRCAIHYTGNGWDLFGFVGIPVKGTAKYPTAFACQISGEPTDAKCDDSDTSGSYWGYYILKNGKWDYATTGASDHKSVCGESQGWVFMETEKTESHLPIPASYSCN